MHKVYFNQRNINQGKETPFSAIRLKTLCQTVDKQKTEMNMFNSSDKVSKNLLGQFWKFHRRI